MKLFALAVCVIVLAVTIVACGSASLEGTSWQGVVALTEVTVTFDDGDSYSSSHFGSGTYSTDGDQVSLQPSGGGDTRVFLVDGSMMQGTVDGWPTTLTKQ